MSMAHSLEGASAIAGPSRGQYCYSLPTNRKLRGFTTKWLLKTAMQKRLPPGIARRKKQGFSIPMKNWIRGELMDYTRDEVFSSSLVRDYFNLAALDEYWKEHQLRRHNHSHLFWALLNLSLWDRLLLRGPRPGTDEFPARPPARALVPQGAR